MSQSVFQPATASVPRRVGRARLGGLRGWFHRGLVVLGISEGGSQLARRRETSLVRALRALLRLDEGGTLGEARAA